MVYLENFDQKTDQEIVQMTLLDQEYFLYIVKRYKLKLFSYIRRISNVPPEEAEDLLQNVFLKIYLNLNDYDGDLKFSSWAYRITHNEVIDNFRKKKARPDILDMDIYDDRLISLRDDFNIEKEIDNKLLKNIITEALNQLDIQYREVLVLKYLEEKDYKEISDIIKKPMGTVASRINRAKEELKKQMLKNKLIYDTRQ